MRIRGTDGRNRVVEVETWRRRVVVEIKNGLELGRERWFIDTCENGFDNSL